MLYYSKSAASLLGEETILSTKTDSTLTLVKGHRTEAAVKHGIESLGKEFALAGKGLGADVK